MPDKSKVYIIGAGSIGMPLATMLAASGASVVAVRTSRDDVPLSVIEPTIDISADERISAPVETASLSQLAEVEDGIVALTSKATANKALAAKLRDKFRSHPVIMMQNGINVERPFIDAGFRDIYRCVLYATGQSRGSDSYRFREVAESPIGVVSGDSSKVQLLVDQLSTTHFRFRLESSIETQVWKKAIINAAFNSICPLLEVDNGIFHRDSSVAAIARTIISEGCAVALRVGIQLSEIDLFDQLLLISRRSNGQLISTLQDINSGKETEIEFLNLEIARIGSMYNPPIAVPDTALLGQLTQAKAHYSRMNRAYSGVLGGGASYSVRRSAAGSHPATPQPAHSPLR